MRWGDPIDLLVRLVVLFVVVWLIVFLVRSLAYG
jgi:hypothetical protein